MVADMKGILLMESVVVKVNIPMPMELCMKENIYKGSNMEKVYSFT